MYDSFDMACHDENTALRLNIKVNSENLLPTQQKYNLGSLRLPADPSWPKIPQRRLSDEVEDLIEPTCTVNGTTGIPQPSQTIVRFPQFQSSKLSATKNLGNLDCRHYSQKLPNEQSHQLRRKSGCTDPRFKKVTTVKSQMTSTDTREKENDERIDISPPTISASENFKLEDKDRPFWKDADRPQVVLQQKAERPDENCKETESVGVQTMCTEITDNLNESVVSGAAKLHEKKLVEIQSPSLANSTRDQFKSETPVLITSLENKTPQNVGNNISKISLDAQSKTPSVQCSQGKDGQIFLKVQKKIQVTTPSENIQDITYIPEGKCMTQCYNVQVPVLSYQNVPVQISAQPQSTVDIPPQFSYSPASNFQSALPFNDMIIPTLVLPSDNMPHFPKLSMNFESKKVENTDKNNTSLIQQCKDTTSKGSTQINQSNGHKYQSSPKKVLKDIHYKAQCYPQQNFSNISKDILPKHNFHIYCHQENKQSIQPKLDITYCRADKDCIYDERQITDTESQFSDNVTRESTEAPMLSAKRDENYNHPTDRLNANFFNGIDDQKDKKCLPAEYKTAYFEKNAATPSKSDSKYETATPTHDQAKDIPIRQKRKMKAGVHLMLNKRRVQSSEPQISNRTGRMPRTPSLKKAKSYLSKSTQQLTPHSESNYLPQHQQYQLTSGHEQNVSNMDGKTTNVKVKSHLNGDKRKHCIKPYQRNPQKSAQITSSLDLKKRIISQLRSPRADTDIIIQKPTAIPVKTQELLNKSYWEYYNKLKLHKMKDDESLQQQYFCQVAMGAPQLKKKKPPELSTNQSKDNSPLGDQMELSPPEIRTLKQCSVLSTMINKNLDSTLQPSSDTIGTKQIYMNGNMRSSSDPTAGTQSAILKKLFPVENEDSIMSSTILYNLEPQQNKHNTSRTLRLKSIGEHPVVFFGCMVYALIVFLPMIYDYLFYEEHDDYEETSYVDTVFEYVVVSFNEVCGEFFDMMNKIFFKPDARMQRLSSGKWRQKISKHHLI